jgi:hypothetical protein
MKTKGLALGAALSLLVSQPVNAAVTISIDELMDGPPLLTSVGIPPGVPGIHNVVATPESLSFTYDDLVLAATTRTRLLFLSPFRSWFQLCERRVQLERCSRSICRERFIQIRPRPR